MRLTLVLLTSLFFSDVGIAYVLFSPSAVRQCSIAKVKKPTFNVCLSGAATSPDLARAKEWATRSVQAWLRVFKMLDKSISPNVNFTCTDPALTIQLLNGSGRSYAQAGRTWIYNEVAYGTWTHELGHAMVGLGDTYNGSTAGQCQSGQPASLMCWGAYGPRRDHNQWSTLWGDDVAGAVVNYQNLYGMTEPSFREMEFNIYGPFPITNPFIGLDMENEVIELTTSDHQVQILQGERLTPINWQAEFE